VVGRHEPVPNEKVVRGVAGLAPRLVLEAAGCANVKVLDLNAKLETCGGAEGCELGPEAAGGEIFAEGDSLSSRDGLPSPFDGVSALGSGDDLSGLPSAEGASGDASALEAETTTGDEGAGEGGIDDSLVAAERTSSSPFSWAGAAVMARGGCGKSST
jgi:hypothetical protein